MCRSNAESKKDAFFGKLNFFCWCLLEDRSSHSRFLAPVSFPQPGWAKLRNYKLEWIMKWLNESTMIADLDSCVQLFIRPRNPRFISHQNCHKVWLVVTVLGIPKACHSGQCDLCGQKSRPPSVPSAGSAVTDLQICAETMKYEVASKRLVEPDAGIVGQIAWQSHWVSISSKWSVWTWIQVHELVTQGSQRWKTW